MRQQRPNIKHPDITKLRDDQLTNEAQYLLEHGKSICADVSSGFYSMTNCLTTRPPVWKTIEDLQLAYDRLQAVIEEIQYRATQMR